MTWATHNATSFFSAGRSVSESGPAGSASPPGTPRKSRPALIRLGVAIRGYALDATSEHRVLLAISVAQLVVTWLLCVRANRPVFVGLADTYEAVDAAILLAFVGTLGSVLVRVREDGRPVADAYPSAWRTIRRNIATPQWTASVALLASTLPLSLALFSSAKRAIPAAVPFTWDRTFDRFGLWLHGGRRAWEWLQPVVGHPGVTVVLDRYYHLGWSLLAIGIPAVVVVSPRSALRRRFLTAWLLLMLLGGTIAATILSSAGPPYFSRVVGGADPYAPLRGYLRAVHAAHPLMSVNGRRALWSAYLHKADLFGLGISAMPSMHIATTALIACLAFAISPWLGTVALALVILTQVCSVALCWHYAIDGYAGALVATAVWWLAGRLERVDKVQ